MKKKGIILGICWLCWVGLIVFLQSGCETEEITDPFQEEYIIEVPDHFPDPGFYLPEDNPMTVGKVELGKMLFFDPVLSRDSSISCASCHLPEHSFSAPKRSSFGAEGTAGRRQSPALINVLYGQSFFWHGSVSSLERQILSPLESEIEMDNTMEEVISRLAADPDYMDMFEKVFGEGPTPNHITDAIASFERTLISADSPFDRYQAGDETALNESQLRGMELFFGEKAECFHCHGGFNFTFEEFHNNGLYEQYDDLGRWEVTGKESDKGKFKVPTLRNIEYTFPYMHDGSMNSLEEVVDHYASGGANHPQKSGLIRRFILSEQEKEDLVNFLKALSDPSFLENPAFQPVE